MGINVIKSILIGDGAWDTGDVAHLEPGQSKTHPPLNTKGRDI